MVGIDCSAGLGAGRARYAAAGNEVRRVVKFARPKVRTMIGKEGKRMWWPSYRDGWLWWRRYGIGLE
jgi:hypothetical protein